MEIIIFVISLLWLMRIAANLTSYIHLWYVKEYRFDRMLIHLKTEQGKWILFLPFRIPPLFPKTVTLFFLTGLSLSLLFVLQPFNTIITLIIVDLITFPLTAVWVLILKIPTFMYHEFLIFLAVRKLRKHMPVKVIGITGSFGKTSTKEYTATILSKKFKVLKTADSKNSPIGIAEVILKNLRSKHEVFVVEMGAYRRGEIARMCRMVEPNVGIVTAINEQHQDLFGSMENTISAKYELIQGLSGKQIAIFNADNSYTLQMAQKAQTEGKRVWLYAIEHSDFPNWAEKVLNAENIRINPRSVEFSIVIDNQRIVCSVHLLGKHHVSNILAALFGSLACGLTVDEAVFALQKIRPFKSTMQPVPGINEADFVDDTFNNNPDAAIAAIHYLKEMNGRKFLIFQPMIELGKYASYAHERVGKHAGDVCGSILLTNRSYYTDFARGVEMSKYKGELQVITPTTGANYIKDHVRSGDTVLFKGKESVQMLKLLTSK